MWLGILLVFVSIMAPVPAVAQSPNILLIIADDQAWTDYGFMGHPEVRTPNLDRLARESLLFPRGYVTASLCCPSLASIITGRYPHEHRVVCNDPPRPAGLSAQEYYASAAYQSGRDRLTGFIESLPTLPRCLAEKGYRSFQSGKWWQGHFSRGGFTEGMTSGDSTTGGRHGDAGLEIGRRTLQPIYDFVDRSTRSSVPWLVWYAPMMPHDPHTPPERLLAYYKGRTNSLPVARYWGMIEWFDETCGQLLDFIDQRGLREQTIVVYVTDNGWITDPMTGRFAPRSKQSPYDGGLRTPIMVRWPGRIQPRIQQRPVSSIDIMPTLLDAAGVRRPDGLPGINLLDRRAVERRTAVFGACFTHDGVDLDRPVSGLRWRWVVSGNWKLIVPANPESGPEGVGIYDLSKDPREHVNREAAEPGRVRRLRRLLDQWWSAPL
ncbi:MAG: sulfatase-like hydrolase/transferase [Verrucomicrobiales bacterium]|nr:sulfatase-like hydrolase/transferase [Verrucomicrobiales bacterium]